MASSERSKREFVPPFGNAALRHAPSEDAALVNAVVDYAIFLLDRAGIVRTWNAGGERITGYAASDIVGRDVSLLYPPHEAAVEPARVLASARESGSSTSEGWRVRKDGSHFWGHAALTAFRDGAGTCSAFACVLDDRSERYFEHAALYESEERYRLLVDGIADRALYVLDRDGTVTSWNACAERIEGYRAEDVVGQNVSIFSTQDDVARGLPARALEVARATGTFEADGWRVRKNGERFWSNVVIERLRNPAGDLIGFAHVTRDLTQDAIDEEQRRLIVEAAPNGLLVVDEAGVVTTCNSQAERIFGYTHGGMAGVSVDTLVAGFVAAHATRGTLDCELAGLRGDGKPLRVDVLSNSIETPRGRIVVASVVDVSERSRAEEQRRASEARLREANRLMSLAEEMAHVGHWRYDVRSDVVSCSAEMYRALELSAETRLSLASFLERHHSADRSHIAEAVDCALAGGAACTYEARVVRPDGSLRDIAAGAHVERDPHGQVVGLVGVFQDVTDRKSAERERDTLFERTSVAMQAGKVGVWELDIPTQVFEWDAGMYALYGLPVDDSRVPYERWERTVHPDDRAAIAHVAELARAGLGPCECEFRVVWPGGDVHHIRCKWTLLHDESGQPQRMIGTNWDITEVRVLSERLREEKERLLEALEEVNRAKQEAERANRAKSDFLARMSHEIRTPMNGIIGFTTLLLDGDPTPEQAHQLTLLSDAGKALLTIINDVLDLSKIEAGKIDLEHLPLSPGALVDGALSIVRAAASEKGLTLDAYVAPDVPAWVGGDPTRLRQILLNLLTNALKFTHQGRIELTVTRERSAGAHVLRFEVSDTGIGIAPERQHLLFQSFSQIDSSISRQYGGTGLGLAISKRLCEAMDGTIGVRSVESEGSVFWFTARLPETLQPPAQGRQIRPGLVGARRVLVADDNPINQIVVEALLKRDGHQVVLAANGRQAVEALRCKPFDIVLMDMEMPVMNGLEATAAIRALPNSASGVPIVALTANAMQSEVQRCLEAGMNDHLAKPIERERLRDALATWTSDAASSPAAPESAPARDTIAVGMLLELFDGDRAAVAEILDAAVVSIQEDLGRIERSLEAGDAKTLAAAAHRMKGTTGSIGSERLSEIGSSIERAARADPATISPPLVAELRRAVFTLRSEVEAYCAAGA